MKGTLLIAIFVILAAGFCIARVQAPAPVKVEGGLVQGTAEDGLTVYRGIPFAAPPVGDLRWRAPQPAVKWDSVKETTKFAPACIQGMMMGSGGRGPAPSEETLKKAGVASIAQARKLSPDKLSGGEGRDQGGRDSGRGQSARGGGGPAGLSNWPIIDGWVIPDDQCKLYESKRYNDVPVLIGYNSDEGLSFSPPRTPHVAGVQRHQSRPDVLRPDGAYRAGPQR
jgi:carboxylesterase type B